jgi:hypothetical protein
VKVTYKGCGSTVWEVCDRCWCLYVWVVWRAVPPEVLRGMDDVNGSRRPRMMALHTFEFCQLWTTRFLTRYTVVGLVSASTNNCQFPLENAASIGADPGFERLERRRQQPISHSK